MVHELIVFNADRGRSIINFTALYHGVSWLAPLLTVACMLATKSIDDSIDYICWTRSSRLSIGEAILSAIIYLFPFALVLIFDLRICMYFLEFPSYSDTISDAKHVLLTIVITRILYVITSICNYLAKIERIPLISILFSFAPLILSIGDVLAISGAFKLLALCHPESTKDYKHVAENEGLQSNAVTSINADGEV